MLSIYPKPVVFIKGRTDGKVAVKKTVTRRDGKTHRQTFWVNPSEIKKKRKKKATPGTGSPLKIGVGSKGNVDNYPGRKGFFIPFKNVYGKTVAIKVPPGAVKGSFRYKGRLFVVHKQYEGYAKGWRESTGYVVSDALSGTPVDRPAEYSWQPEKRFVKILNGMADKNRNEFMQMVAKNPPVSSYSASSKDKVVDPSENIIDVASASSAVDRLLKEAKVSNATLFKDLIMDTVTTESDLESSIKAFRDSIDSGYDIPGVLKMSDIANELIKVKEDFVNMTQFSGLLGTVRRTLRNFEETGNMVGVKDFFKWVKKHTVNIALDPDAFNMETDDYQDDIDGYELINEAIRNDLSISSVWQSRQADGERQRKLNIEMYESYLALPLKERERALMKGPISRKRSLSLGINKVFRVTTGKNPKVDGVWKSKDGEQPSRDSVPTGTFYIREELAYELAKTIGSDLIPPTVITEVDGVPGSMQEFKYNCKQAADVPSSKRPKVSKEDKFEISVLDFLFGNTDRHNGNWLLQGNTNRPVLIDHGLCFPDDIKQLRLNPNLTVFGEIPKGLLDRVSHANWKPFLKKMRSKGLSEKAIKGFKQRLKYITDSGEMPSLDTIREAQAQEAARLVQEAAGRVQWEKKLFGKT